MTRRTVAMSLGALVVVSATFVGVQTAHAGEPCTITNPHINATHATFDVQGHCTVTLVSYEKHGSGTLGEQTLYDSTTEEFSCATTSTGSATSSRQDSSRTASPSSSAASSSPSPCSHDLTVTVPDCEHQLDLVLGQPRNAPIGYKPGEVLTWRYGGEGECQPPSTTTSTVTSSTVESSTTTTSPPPVSTPTTTVVVGPASSVTPSASVPVDTPTELPHTGGGELLPVALGALGLGLGADQVGRWRGRKARL